VKSLLMASVYWDWHLQRDSLTPKIKSHDDKSEEQEGCANSFKLQLLPSCAHHVVMGTALSWKKMVAHSSRSCCFWYRTGCIISCSNTVSLAMMQSKTIKSLTWKFIHHLQSAMNMLCNLLTFKMGEYHPSLCCFNAGWNGYIHDLSIIKMWWRNMSLSFC
jgi:hypothetical protein